MQRRDFLVQTSRVAVGYSLLPLAGCTTAPPSRAAKRDAYLEALTESWEKSIPQWLREANLPGASVAVVRDGRLAWQRGFGVKDVGSGEPVDNDTVFAACSDTKPVFAYAVAKLCERGLMDLDTPLTRYTTERIIPDPRLELITARHVLTHTTGFPNWRQEPAPLTLEFTPGERFQYSGEGFSYLQAVVERVTGKSFEAFLMDHLLAPFGMNSSRVTWDMPYVRRMAKPHDKAAKRIQGKFETLRTASDRERDLARYGAAACLLTTPGDYAKFFEEILDPRPADAFRLTPSGLREYLRPQVKKDDAQSMALGWVAVARAGIPTLYTHAGQDAGYYCSAVMSPAKKSALMIMMNGDNYEQFFEKSSADPLSQQFFA